MALSTEELNHLAYLSRLSVNATLCEDYTHAINKILEMMDILSDVNTDNITPLTNVHDGVQVLRADVVDANGLAVNRELNQSVAPKVQDGLYLVPQVIE